MSLSEKIIGDVLRQMIPWSAAHVTSGKLMAMSESVFNVAGFRQRFKKGDIIFGRTILGGKQFPVIYAVSNVGEYLMDPTMDITWTLRLIGGFGPKEIDIKHASGSGTSPHLTYDGYFRDWDDNVWRPTLNYYAERIVRGGKTIWDVDQALHAS
jgi:hypothetical protein